MRFWIFTFLVSMAFAIQTSTTSDGLSGYYRVIGGSMHLMCSGTPSSADLSGIFYPDEGNNFEGGYSVTGRSTTCDSNSQGGIVGAENNEQSGNSYAAMACVFQAVNGDPVYLKSECVLVNRSGYFSLNRIFYKISEPDTNSILKGNTSTIS